MLTNTTLHKPLTDADGNTIPAWQQWTEDTTATPSFAPPAQDFAAPVQTAAGAASAPTQALYLTEPGDTAAISLNDIHQGQMGDCYLLSSIGEIALRDPSVISSRIIHANTNGTESVTLYTSANGHVPGFGARVFRPSTQTVTNSFPTNSVNNGANQDVVAGQKEIWPQVIEKAYAQANGGYGGIANGGNPCIAIQELTGHTATWQSAASLSLAALTRDVAAGDLIVMDTGNASNLPYGLVGNHAYMFEGLKSVGGVANVQLGNPWGFDNPSLIPLTQLARGIVEVDVGHV